MKVLTPLYTLPYTSDLLFAIKAVGLPSPNRTSTRRGIHRSALQHVSVQVDNTERGVRLAMYLGLCAD